MELLLEVRKAVRQAVGTLDSTVGGGRQEVDANIFLLDLAWGLSLPLTQYSQEGHPPGSTEVESWAPVLTTGKVTKALGSNSLSGRIRACAGKQG